MGWAAGSSLAQRVWDRLEREIAPENRAAVALEILNLFSEEDADDWESCEFVEQYLIWDEDESEWRIKTDEDREAQAKADLDDDLPEDIEDEDTEDGDEDEGDKEDD